jgi:hypothetical protein
MKHKLNTDGIHNGNRRPLRATSKDYRAVPDLDARLKLAHHGKNPKVASFIEWAAFVCNARQSFSALTNSRIRQRCQAMTWTVPIKSVSNPRGISYAQWTAFVGQNLFNTLLDAIENRNSKFFSDIAKLLTMKSSSLMHGVSPLDTRLIQHIIQTHKSPRTIPNLRKWICSGPLGVKESFDDKTLRERAKLHGQPIIASPRGRPRR